MKARWPVQQRLAVLLQRHPTLAGVKVTPSPPTQMTSAAEHVFCVGTTGSLTAGPLVSGRQINDDEFTVDVRVITRKGGDMDGVQSRLATLCGAVYDVIADGEVDGLPLVDWGVEDDWEVHEVSEGEVTIEPQLDPQENFPYATALIGVDVEVRYFGGNR